MVRVSAGRLVIAVLLATALAACRPGSQTVPPGSPDQSLAEAMRLVCDAPARADRDGSGASRSDRIAGHLTDGIGNTRVLTTVEAWKTDGIDRGELARLVRQAGLRSCALQREAD